MTWHSDLRPYLEAAAAVRPTQPPGQDVVSPHEQRSADGRLRFQRCVRCGYLRYPFAPICPECLDVQADWVADSGDGTVWSFCIYHRAFHPAFAGLLPYVVALIELDSGPRLVTNIVGVDRADIHIGLRGRAVPEPLPGGGTLIYFLPSTPGRQS